MKQNKKKIFWNSIFLNTSTVIDKGLFFFINIIIARYLSREAFGEYTTALGIATFFSFLMSLGLYYSVVRSINLDPKNSEKHFGNSLLLRLFLGTAVYFSLIIFTYITDYNENTIKLILLLGAVRIGNQFIVSFHSLFDAKDKFSITAIINILFSCLFFLITVFVIYLKGDYFDFAYTRIILVSVFILALFILTNKRYPIKTKLSLLKKFIYDTIPFGLQVLYNNVILRANVMILSLMRGTLATGVFNNGFLILPNLSFIPLNIGRVITPRLYKLNHNKNREEFQFAFDIVSKIFAVASLYVFLIFFLYADKIILLLFTEKYQDSIDILKIISFGIPPLFNSAALIITAMDKQKYNTRIMGWATIFNIIVNIILIHFLNTKGAAYAAVSTYLIIFIISHIYIIIISSIKLKTICINYIKAALISTACLFLFNYIHDSTHWIISILILTIAYFVLVASLMIRGADIKILHDIIK